MTKKSHGKLWRSVVSGVLAFSLAASMMVPAFAAESAGGGVDLEPEKAISYVSIGDSMTNGYGLDGYEELNEAGTDFINWYGFQRNEVKGSYPYKVAENYAWELNQIATSGLRADDVYYLLNLGTDYEVNWDEYGDAYMAEKFRQAYRDDHNGRLDGDDKVIAWAAEQYQEAVKAADVVSVGIGSNNFATLMDMRMMWWMGRILGNSQLFGGYSGGFDFNSLVADLTDEEKQQINKLYAEVEGIMLDTVAEYGISTDAVFTTDGATVGDFVKDMTNAIAYTSAGFALGYKGIVDTIIRENNDAEIIIVGLTNWFRGMVYALPIGDEVINFPLGDLMDVVCEFAGVYMAALPAAYELEAMKNGTELQPIYFADTNAEGVEDVELIVDVIVEDSSVDLSTLEGLEGDERFEAAKKIAEGVSPDALPSGTTRARLLQAMGGYVIAAMGMTPPTLYEVENFEAKVADYNALSDDEKATYEQYAEWGYGPNGMLVYAGMNGVSEDQFPGIIAYLGLEKSMITSLHLDAVNVEDFKIMSSMETLMGVAGGALEDHMTADPNDIAGAMIAVPELLTVSNLMFNFLVGSGVIVHPSDDGHTTIANVIIDAYDSKQTALKETIETLIYVVSEYYDEAYAFGYQYAKDNGYIAAVIEGIDKAIEELENVVLPEDATPEFKAEFEAAVKEAKEALEAAKNLIETADVLDAESFEALLELLNESLDALEVALAAAEQAGVDIHNLAVVPFVKNELIPAAKAAAELAAEKAAEFLAEKAAEAYAAFLAALPQIDAALYDWFYNNPDKVCGFFAEYGDEMGALFAEHGNSVFAVLGYIAYEYGPEVLEYVLANPEKCLNDLVAWYEKYGDRVWDMVDVYLEYLGVYDAIEAQIAVLEGQLAELKAELEKAAGEMEAAVKAEIEKQIAIIEAQIAQLEKALADLEAALFAFQAGVEAQIEAAVEALKAALADVKAALAELKILAQGLNSDIQALIANIEAAVAALEALVGQAVSIEAFFGQVIELIAGVKDLTEAVIADATHGEYAINPAASYVALGDATIAADGSYADQVAAFMANLAGSMGVQSDYEKAVVVDEDDLVATTADILAAVEAGELDEVLADAGLVTVSAGAEDLTVSVVYQLIEVLTAFAMPSSDEAVACDWASLVGAEAAAVIEKALVAVEAELVNQIGDEATAAMATDAIEAVAFGYAGFAVNYVELLDAVQAAAPNAHIVAVGLTNVLDGLTLDIDGFELALGEYAAWVIKAADLEMLTYAALDEGANVTFVSAPNAACDAAAVIAEIVELAMAIDLESNPAAVLELLPLIAQIAETATWMPNEAGQAYIAEQILGSVDFAAVADAVYTAEPAQPVAVVAVDGVVTETVAASEAVEVTDEAVAVVTLEDGCAVEATFAIEHLATVESFEDFEADAWYLEEGQGSFAELRTLYMDYALATGLMSGYAGSNLFGAWDSLDRAQAATVIYRMAVEDASATLVPELYADNATTMADVEDGMYYTAAVNWCVENGIITGYQAGPNAGKFKPYNKVTRSELAAMIQRYCVNVCGVEMIEADVMGYEDSGLIDTTWALPGLQFCKAYGIMTGVFGKNVLNPVGKANRAEAAKMFSVVGHDIL